jgi:hypothetical protein
VLGFQFAGQLDFGAGRVVGLVAWRRCVVSGLGLLGLQGQHQVIGVLAAQGALDGVDDELRLADALALGGKFEFLFEQGVHADRQGHDGLRQD